MAERRIVVVGAGVGGLVSACLLGARGVPVILLDKEAGPGGKLRALDVDGASVDAGPTVFTLRQVFDEVFDAAGDSLDRVLTLRPASVLARHAWGEARLDLHADPAHSEAAIGAFAGAEAARGYRAFRDHAARVYRTLDASFLRATNTNPVGLSWRIGLGHVADLIALRPYASLWTLLGEYFRDPRLRQLFARYATYAGSSPFHAPSTLSLIAHVEAMGVWMIEGGMHALAAALERLAIANGVVCRYRADVAEILVERGRACGVVLADGERIEADRVIVNADPEALATGRFGTAARRAVAPARRKARSLSAMVWLARGRASGFPLVRHNVVFSDDYPAEFTALRTGRLAEKPTVYVCAQDRDDAGTAPAGPERFQIIVNAPPRGDAGGFTEGEIDRCTQAMRSALGQAGLSLDPAPGAMRLLTPTDFERLSPSTGGALYGRASHGWAASFLRQGSRTRIAGLYCAGGSTHPGAGVPMAALSGRLAADCVLKDLASMSRSRIGAMPGGMSMPSVRTGATA